MDATAHVFDATLPQLRTGRHPEIEGSPGAGRFLGRLVRAVQDPRADPGKARGEFAGGFLLAKVDVDKEQQLAGYFQIKSIPTVMLVKDGQIVDGFPGALPEGQLREFLKHHGIEPSAPAEERAGEVAAAAPRTRMKKSSACAPRSHAEPDKAELKLDLALALLATGGVARGRSSCSTPCPPTWPPTTAPSRPVRALDSRRC